MLAERANLSPQEIKREAAEWYARQLALLEKAHGSSWPAHREWIEAYLREELREHLLARGWRPKR